MGFGRLTDAQALRGRTGVVLVLAIAMVLGLLSARAARADVPFPDNDPFYAAPANLADYPNGAVVGTRPIRPFGLPLPVSAWQLRYRTTDAVNRPMLDVATVVVPNVPWKDGPRPLLSYQVPEDSLGTQCAPSFALSGGHDPGVANTLLDVPFMTAALLHGWALVISDYEGPYSRFLDGPGTGRAVLDGVQAALSFGHGGVRAASPVGAWGYSGGAFATLWAAQLRSSYAPQVRFAGISAGGVPADISAIAQRVDGGPQAGLALLIVMALTLNHPESGLTGLFNARGRALLAANADACGSKLVPQYEKARLDTFTTAPNLLGSREFRGTTAANELGVTAPDSPMYLYHSKTDDVIPVAGFSALVDRYCSMGAPLTAIHSVFPTHNGAAAGEALGGMNYLADRFAGRPVTPGCTIR
jgi:hypothetical protein